MRLDHAYGLADDLLLPKDFYKTLLTLPNYVPRVPENSIPSNILDVDILPLTTSVCDGEGAHAFCAPTFCVESFGNGYLASY